MDLFETRRNSGAEDFCPFQLIGAGSLLAFHSRRSSMDITVRLSIDVKGWSHRPPVVLLVSGDADRRSVMRRVLEREGYGVLGARHPGHALVTAMRYRGPVDLLVADEGDGSGKPEFPASLFLERPGLKLLRIQAGPRTREELLDSVHAALHATPVSLSDRTLRG